MKKKTRQEPEKINKLLLGILMLALLVVPIAGQEISGKENQDGEPVSSYASENVAWNALDQAGIQNSCIGSLVAEQLVLEMFNKTGEEAGYSFPGRPPQLQLLNKSEYGCGNFSNGPNRRNIIEANAITTSGDQIRVALEAGQSKANIANMAICERAWGRN